MKLAQNCRRAILEEYGSRQSRLAATIFKAMALNLKLEQKHSESYLSTATGFLRVYRYPLCFEADQQWGIHEHTDSSVLSILNQDETEGFQVFKDGKWLHVPPVRDSVIVNLGDLARVMSDDRYVSVKHRVKANKFRERISIGYFVFPEEDVVIESSKYRPFTNGDFRAEVQQNLKTVGYKIGIQSFKLATPT